IRSFFRAGFPAATVEGYWRYDAARLLRTLGAPFPQGFRVAGENRPLGWPPSRAAENGRARVATIRAAGVTAASDPRLASPARGRQPESHPSRPNGPANGGWR